MSTENYLLKNIILKENCGLEERIERGNPPILGLPISRKNISDPLSNLRSCFWVPCGIHKERNTNTTVVVHNRKMY